MSDSFEQLLDRAASLFGIEPGFWDIFGTHHTTSADTKRDILCALGIATDGAEALERSLAGIARLDWERPLPPVGRRRCSGWEWWELVGDCSRASSLRRR